MPVDLPKYTVIGDVCLDVTNYIDRYARVNPEDSSVPLWQIKYSDSELGMAGNYNRMLNKLGAKNLLFNGDSSYDSVKVRYFDYLTSEYISRVDLDNKATLNLLKHPLIGLSTKGKIVIVADYQKGMVTRELAEYISTQAARIYVDSKSKDISYFKNATVKVNEHEFANLKAQAGIHRLLVTKGSKGSVLYDSKHKVIAEHHGSGVDAQNVSGAGDVFFSAFIYAENELQYSPKDSLKYATCAAGISIQYNHTYIPSKEEIDAEFNKTTG